MKQLLKIAFIACLVLGCQMAIAQVSTIGKASYYSNVFQGKKTANGDIYDKNKLTAAHRTLDFNTKVKVTNLSNKKMVIVTINDRGPHKKSRIIDLSEAAAKQIDLIQQGITKVKIEIIEDKP